MCSHLCLPFRDEPAKIESGSDSDDDCMFVEATYEPLLDKKGAPQVPG